MSVFGIIAAHGASVTLQRPTVTTAASGARTQTWAAVGDTLTGWVQPTTADIREEYGSRDIDVTHAVYFATDPAVQIGDRLLIGSTYYVVRGDREQAGVAGLWRVDCEETR